MAFFLNKSGNPHHVELPPDLYTQAHRANLSVPEFVNRMFAQDCDIARGSAFQQLCASEGLTRPDKNEFGLRPATLADILDGKAGQGYQAAGNTNTTQGSSPFGSQSRTLFPAAVIEMIESELVKDYGADEASFGSMVALEQSIASDNFEQPVVNYNNTNGPMQARSQRIAQLAEPARILTFTTSDRIRKLPTWSFGMEFSDQALRASTLDIVALTMARFLAVESDAHTYEFMSDIWTGDGDLNTGAVSAVTAASLDSASTTMANFTHKAWVKFLARNRRYRKITHVIGDIDTYLAVEGRLGRPGSNNYDPTLARIDPQARVMNNGFGNDVKWFIVDPATSGGPVPANTVWALDASKGIVRVRNTAASYSAAEDFVLRRAKAMRVDQSEQCYRMFGDNELRPFDVLTIA